MLLLLFKVTCVSSSGYNWLYLASFGVGLIRPSSQAKIALPSVCIPGISMICNPYHQFDYEQILGKKTGQKF
jgi:hypothetical protein